jgi:hypothetical protein
MQPNRIAIETRGSAFPATLAIEVNRLPRSREHEVDGCDWRHRCKNWNGDDDTSRSYTAKLQAKYTLRFWLSWEELSDQLFDIVCLDRLGDLEFSTPWAKSDKGRVDKDIGIDSALLSKESNVEESHRVNGHSSDYYSMTTLGVTTIN